MFSYISTFSGAGGLDIGLERSGLRAISMCEIDPVFQASLVANQGWWHSDGRAYFEDAAINCMDIREARKADLLNGATAADVVVGGPPCQAFSSSGKQLSILDPRGALVREFVRVVDEIRPRMFLFENVRGLITARDAKGCSGGVIRDIIQQLEEIGYSCRAALLNSADYGSYQRRVRCFLIGSSRGTAPDVLPPTHAKKGDILLSNWRSLREFLAVDADLDERNYVYPTDRLSAQLADLPNGSGLKSGGKKEPTRPGGHWGYRQGTFIADLELPARTVTGSASQDWVRWNGELRRLTFEEVKKLQGFPADWIIEGPKAARFKQVGNAVPTIFGQMLGNIIIKHLSSFPNSEPQAVPLPRTFEGYISYTERDHRRNASARTVHKNFETADVI
jgi:DNA (cytosine-5)-methyltransferase 1